MITLAGRPIEIETPRLRVRPLQVTDITGEYVAGLNDPRVNAFLVGVKATPQTMETIRAYVAANAADPHAVLLGLFPRERGAAEDGGLIGTVRLHEISAMHHTATIGVCLFRPAWWGRGLSAEAIDAICAWAFRHTEVRYLEAGCYEANQASVKTFMRAGFDVAARYEDKYLLDGRPAPVVFLRRVHPDGRVAGSAAARHGAE